MNRVDKEERKGQLITAVLLYAMLVRVIIEQVTVV